MAQAQPQDKERGLVAYRSRDGQEIRLTFDTVKKFLVSGHPEMVTEQEIMLYMGICKARGLNPFKKDCYLVKYTPGDSAAVIVSIDFYRARASAQPNCDGWKCGIVVKVGPHELEEREGSIILEDEELIGGWFFAKLKDRETPVHWTVPLSRYIKKTKEGRVTQFWQESNQPEQIAKVAESQGLRRAWPDEFAKLYIKEEIVEGLTVDHEPMPRPEIKPPQRKAYDEQAGTEQTSERHTDNNRKSPESDRVPTEHGAGPAQEKGPTDEDRKAWALKWIAEIDDAEFLANKDFLTTAIKGMKVVDQNEICRAHNIRRKAITDALKG